IHWGRLAGGNTSPINQEREVRIRKHLRLESPEYFPSSYDTAWVAMVPLPGSNHDAPCFPQCVEWILENQHGDGSWGTNKSDSSVNKDTLLSTLACVVALKKWNVGSEQTKREFLDMAKIILAGLQFVARNLSIVMDQQIDAPVSFNITFPALVSLATGMGLEFPATETSIDGILNLRNMELERLACEEHPGKEAYCAYVAEGFVTTPGEWNIVMKSQRKNGSLFNSPAATAAVLVNNYDDRAFHYLNSIVNTFGSAVPTLYPLNTYYQLLMVDTLNNVGISRHFSTEIKSIMDKTYILWSQRDEEIMLDIATCAMAFRLLRMNGYDVSSEQLSHVAEASSFYKSIEGYLNDTKTLLELYKASKLSLSANESILEKIGCWSGSLLNEKLYSDPMQRIPYLGEVEYSIKFPFYAMVEPIHHRRNIEHFDVSFPQKLKRKNLPCHIDKDILTLGAEDFRLSQSMYQEELKLIESWQKENKLDQLQFIRKNLINCYLSAATTISPHELSDARVACAKTIALILVADDFFDIDGSEEELKDLISLVQKWDQHHEVEFYSQHVKVVFWALYTTVNQLGAKASVLQNRDVTKYIVESWLDLLWSLETDAEWQRNKYVPTMEEYMTNATHSFALGPIIHTTLYFLETNLWEDIVKYPEYKELFRLLSSCGRLQNDVQSFEREFKDGKLNSVALLIHHSGGSMSIEEAKEAIEESIASHRRDLLQLVLREDSLIPKTCRDLVWRLYKTSHVFYSQADGFSSPKEMMGALNAVINEPLKLESTSISLADQLKNKNML
ncbi:hypothetical protein EJB05_08829, partial [Eragrostis curvula]